MNLRPIPSLVILAVLLILAGCSSLPGGSPVAPTAQPSPLPADTAVPTPLPPDPLAILILPADLPRSQADAYQSFIYDLAQESGFRFQVRNSLSPAEIEPGLKIVVALAPDPGLQALASAAPQTQFLALGIRGLEPAPNLTTIGATGERPDIQAFLAGYIAATISPDWRVGVMVEKDSPGGAAALDGFRNGVLFFCGICNPAHPPYYRYPIAVELPLTASGGEATAFADALLDRQVASVYVYPTIASPQLLDYLASTGIQIIGAQTPPDNLRENWVASIEPDLFHSIETIWPELVAGNGGRELPSPLTLTHINPALLSPGKQRLAEEMLDNLLNGLVDTGVQP